MGVEVLCVQLERDLEGVMVKGRELSGGTSPGYPRRREDSNLFPRCLVYDKVSPYRRVQTVTKKTYRDENNKLHGIMYILGNIVYIHNFYKINSFLSIYIILERMMTLFIRMYFNFI